MDKLDLLLIVYRRKRNGLRPSVFNKLEQFCSTLLDLDRMDKLKRRDVLNLSKGYKELINQMIYGD